MGLGLEYIDGQTPISEEEKEGLLIKSISTQKELNSFEQLNIENALIWLIRTNIKKEEILTEKFIKRLHQKMFGDVWNWAGDFRKTNKNLGVTWPEIPSHLTSLLDDATSWIENNTYPPDQIAIEFKHRLVSIHCFANGNGRHSRMMANIIVSKLFDKETFTWSSSNMAEENDVRKEYINAIKLADNGNILRLIAFARKK